MTHKKVLASMLVVLVGVSLVLAQDVDLKNVDQLLKNKSFMQVQFRCLLNGKPCDRLGLRISKALPESIKAGKCVSCTQEELQYVDKVHEYIKTNYPNEYKQLQAKYGVSENS